MVGLGVDVLETVAREHGERGHPGAAGGQLRKITVVLGGINVMPVLSVKVGIQRCGFGSVPWDEQETVCDMLVT